MEIRAVAFKVGVFAHVEVRGGWCWLGGVFRCWCWCWCREGESGKEEGKDVHFFSCLWTFLLKRRIICVEDVY